MNNNISRNEPFFPINKEIGKRDWGSETLIHLAEGKWSMKKLFIKAGKKGGLQYHRVKDEASYLVTGKLIIRYLFEGKLVESWEKVIEKQKLFESLEKSKTIDINTYHQLHKKEFDGFR